jgi:hypothetical protein
LFNVSWHLIAPLQFQRGASVQANLQTLITTDTAPVLPSKLPALIPARI